MKQCTIFKRMSIKNAYVHILLKKVWESLEKEINKRAPSCNSCSIAYLWGNICSFY